jgi:hypothetical protein
VKFEWHAEFSEVLDEPQQAVRVLVDGRDLAEIVRAVELPYAEAEGRPQIAGQYAGLGRNELPSAVREHFLGTDGSDLGCGPADKTVLLDCVCGSPGCWPLMARIEVRESEVIWSDFEQPHRSGRWSYGAFGPITFERAQYEKALDAITNDTT